jgi:hypothetical protein
LKKSERFAEALTGFEEELTVEMLTRLLTSKQTLALSVSGKDAALVPHSSLLPVDLSN